ncbi:MAG: hypothetical protein RR406_00085 [Bacilli bacterium]
MKNVMIVARQGNAVALSEGTKICKSGTGVFMPSLLALKEVLESISIEPCETVNIHIMDTIQGLMSGSAVEYVKSGKTLSGTTLSVDEINAFKDIYKLYAERILNIRFSLVKYIKTDNVAMQNLKKSAYDELAVYEKSVGVSRGTAVTVDPDKELRDMFDAQIKECMINKDFDTMKMLMAERKNLREPEVVSSGPAPISPPAFEDKNNAGDNKPVTKDNTDNTNDDPIKFESAGGAQPQF